VLLVFVVAGSYGLNDTGSASLRYYFEKGKLYDFLVEMEANVTQRMGTREIETADTHADLIRRELRDLRGDTVTALV
jgi:hypothetical protein